MITGIKKDNRNILTKDDCIFLADILIKYTNQNKFDYFLNEDKFNQIYNKLNKYANIQNN